MEETKSKKRLALFGMGTMGGRDLKQRVPVLIDLFTRLSYDYEIVFYSFSPVDKRQVPEGITVRQPVSLRMPAKMKYFFLALRCVCDHLVNPLGGLFAISIYPTGRWAVFVSRIIRRPVIVQVIALEFGAMPEVNIRGFLKPWLRKIILDVCKKTDALVTVSEYQKKLAVTGLPFQRHMENLPLRVNASLFHYRERTVTLPVKFIHVAYYSKIKDQDTMFAAFAKVAEAVDCHLMVIGDNFNNPKVHGMLRDLKIEGKVTLAGFVEHSKLPRYLDDAHILLHTPRFETGCAVIQEAMASGVAVCGTNVGLLSDIHADDRYAMVVPAQDSEQLARKIIQLVDDPKLFRRITQEANQWITTHDSAWAYKNYRTFINTVLEKHAG